MSLLNRKAELLEKLRNKTEYLNNCWVFTGSNNGHGYGQLRVSHYTTVLVHRLSCHLFHDMELHSSSALALHKPECEYKACWNPAHLYVGNQKQNIRDVINAGKLNGWKNSAISRIMKQVCKRGHEFTTDNTYITPQGHRRCLACRKIRGN